MEKILLVDDDPLFLSSMSKVFSSLYEVDWAKNAVEALEKVSVLNYDLIILDYNMQPMNGLECLRRIRSQGGDCAVILITGFGTFELATEALENEAFTILPKPIDLKKLKEAVKKAIQNRALMHQSKFFESQQNELQKMNHMLEVVWNQYQDAFNNVSDMVMLLEGDRNVASDMQKK